MLPWVLLFAISALCCRSADIARLLKSLLDFYSIACLLVSGLGQTKHSRHVSTCCKQSAMLSTILLRKLLPAWKATTELLQQARAEASTAAIGLFRQHTARKVLEGWREEMLVITEQRSGLWRLMLVLLQRQRTELLQAAVCTWQGYAYTRIALRSSVATFVNKRRLECLSKQFSLWHQFSRAMRGAEGAAAAAAWVVSPPVGSLTAKLYSSKPGYSSSAGLRGRALDVEPVRAHSCSPPGVLPVTAGSSSPLLRPRSAHQDRTLARRLAAMSGGAPEVRGGGGGVGRGGEGTHH